MSKKDDIKTFGAQLSREDCDEVNAIVDRCDGETRGAKLVDMAARAKQTMMQNAMKPELLAGLMALEETLANALSEARGFAATAQEMLKSETIELRAQLGSKDNVISTIQTDLDDARKMLDDSRAALNASEVSQAQAEHEALQCREAKDFAVRAAEHKDMLIEHLTKENEDLRTERDAAEATASALESEILELKRQLAEMQPRQAAMTEETAEEDSATVKESSDD